MQTDYTIQLHKQYLLWCSTKCKQSYTSHPFMPATQLVICSYAKQSHTFFKFNFVFYSPQIQLLDAHSMARLTKRPTHLNAIPFLWVTAASFKALHRGVILIRVCSARVLIGAGDGTAALLGTVWSVVAVKVADGFRWALQRCTWICREIIYKIYNL